MPEDNAFHHTSRTQFDQTLESEAQRTLFKFKRIQTLLTSLKENLVMSGSIFAAKRSESTANNDQKATFCFSSNLTFFRFQPDHYS